MAATHPGHLAGTQSGLGSGPPVPGEIVTDRGAAPGLDGNAVSVERETVKIASNQLRYDAIASLTSGALSTLVWAATDGRGG
jgi:flagellar basal-body rod protein FlgB